MFHLACQVRISVSGGSRTQMKTHFVLRNNELHRENQENHSSGLLQSHTESSSADQFWQSLQPVQPRNARNTERQRSAPRGLISSFWPLRDETFGELYRAAPSCVIIVPHLPLFAHVSLFLSEQKTVKGGLSKQRFLYFIYFPPPACKK